MSTETTTQTLQPFSLKKIGANLATHTKKDEVGNPLKFSRKVSIEEFDKIKKKVELYNKKPTESRRAEIIKLASPEAAKTKAAKEKATTAVKAIGKRVEKGNSADKTLLQQLEDELTAAPESVAAFQKLLNKFKVKEEEAPKAAVTERPSRKEVYRDGRKLWIYVDKAGVEVKEDGSPLGS